MTDAFFSLAGLCIRFSFDGIEANELRPFLDELAPFRGSEGDPDLSFRVRPAAPVPGPLPGEALARAVWAPMHRFPFEKNPETWLRLRLRALGEYAGAPEVARVFGEAARAGWDRVFLLPLGQGPAVFFPEEGRVEVFIGPKKHPSSVSPGLMSAFFQVLSVCLASKNGILVHGSGLVRGGGGWAFIGLSGAGKSTVGRISPGALLADDGLVLRKAEGVFRVFATPFCQQKNREAWREGVEIGSAPLQGVYFLEQAPEHRIGPIPGPEAALSICQHYIHYYRLFPDAQGASAFRTTAELVREVPCKRLYFRKDPGFWDLLE